MDRLTIDRQARREAYEDAMRKMTVEIDKDKADLQLLSDLLDVFEEKRKQLAISDGNLLREMLNETNCTKDEYLREVMSIEALKDEALLMTNKVRSKMGMKREWECDDYGSSNSQLSSRASGNGRSCKLPKLTLPQFAGDLRDWMPFWSQFLKIHDDESLNDSDKLSYLRQSTIEGSIAREIVESYPLTAENYKNAVESLRERFGREDLLIQVYVRDLIGLVITNIKSKESCTVSGLYIKLSTQLRALETLNVTNNMCAAIIYPLVESCLPDELLRIWERNREQFNGKSSEDDLQNLMKFLQNESRGEEHIKLARTGFPSPVQNFQKPKAKFGMEKPRLATASGLLSTRELKKRRECIFCSGQHFSQDCGKAQGMTLEQKQTILKKSRKCFTCFRDGHRAKECRTFIKCVICGRRHQPIMCPSNTSSKVMIDSDNRRKEAIQPSSSSTSMANVIQSPEIQLQTLLVNLRGEHGMRTIRALVDTGSQKSYVTSEVARDCQLEKVGEELIIHNLFGGVRSSSKRHTKYSATFCGLNNGGSYNLVVSDIPKISDNISAVPEGPWMEDLQRYGIVLSDNQYGYTGIDVLFGADIAGKLITGRKVELSTGPVAVETIWGWTLMGKLKAESPRHLNSTTVNCSLINNEDYIKNLWSLDILGISDPAEKQSKDELAAAALEHFKATVTRLPSGRYEVNLPWISGHPPLANNRNIALKRVTNVKRKLLQDGKLEAYHKIFEDWELNGIIEAIPKPDCDTFGYYLPHRPVYKPQSTTTPIRPVFDASAKTYMGPSLNDCLEKGVNHLEHIPDLLMRFRLHKEGVVADVKRAFLQMSVAKPDRDFLRFLWYENPTSDLVKEYRHCRVVFGVTSSPFLLASTIQYHLERAPLHLQVTATLLQKALYVDNCILSVANQDEALTFQKNACELLSTAQFELRGWEFGYEKSSTPISVLGMLWHPDTDQLSCDVKDIFVESPVTKRKILSLAHRIFDPVGFTCPFNIIPKMILQKACALKLKWDQPVPEELAEAFMKWVDQLKHLKEIRIPRWINPCGVNVRNWSLHVFVDASKVAYAAVVYLRIEMNNCVLVSLLQAKARVTPMKLISMPRLELISCLIGARLALNVKDGLDVGGLNIYYWTDCTTALTWIRTNQVWTTFVNNRVKEIRMLSEIGMWKHVPGELNPADFPSRGGTINQLQQSVWWEGPTWLKSKPEDWPPQRLLLIDSDEVQKERKKTVVSCLVVDDSAWYLTRFSDYHKLLVITAWMYRFVQNARTDKGSRNLQSSLSTEELRSAENVFVRLIQQQSFEGVEDKRILPLRPYYDSEGIIRVETKILLGDEVEAVTRPCLIPGNHVLVKRMIQWHHLNMSHAGVQTLQVKLRETFWIINSRRIIRSVVKACQRCKRFAAKSLQCDPPPLPRDRVKNAKIFEVVGVDMAGPLFLKNGEKAWIAFFTCAVYRAVHLELTTTLSADGFIQVLRRFVARRGKPFKIYCDNGTNFVGTFNMFRKIDWEMVKKYASSQRMIWMFNPPTAAWWGGFWERLVGVVKQTLRKVLGKACLSYEELMTILTETESLVNHRPLTYVSEEIDDLVPLTPAMFLEELPHAELPEADLSEAASLSRRVRFRQAIRDAVKSRFKREYLTQLAHRGKTIKAKELRVGDIVLIGSDIQKRIDWPIGRVVATFPGRDGEIRTTRIKTSSRYILRPIQRLYPTEIEILSASAEKVGESQPAEISYVTKSGRKVRAPDRFMLLANSLNIN